MYGLMRRDGLDRILQWQMEKGLMGDKVCSLMMRGRGDG